MIEKASLSCFCMWLYLVFLQSLRYYVRSWLPARAIVIDSLSSRKDIDASGEIIVLNKSCPVSVFEQIVLFFGIVDNYLAISVQLL